MTWISIFTYFSQILDQIFDLILNFYLILNALIIISNIIIVSNIIISYFIL